MADEITLDAPETRIERFLAAAAGVEGIPLDEPQTRIERYLYKIAQGSGGVPPVEDADKGKYLHANESTGDLEWATAGGSGGGGVLAVHDEDGTLDKTWREIIDAVASTGAVVVWENDGTVVSAHIITLCEINIITQKFIVAVAGTDSYYEADTESDYPVLQQ